MYVYIYIYSSVFCCTLGQSNPHTKFFFYIFNNSPLRFGTTSFPLKPKFHVKIKTPFPCIPIFDNF